MSTYSPEQRSIRAAREQARRDRLRPLKIAALTPRYCAFDGCGEVIPYERTRNARYCSDGCRRQAQVSREDPEVRAARQRAAQQRYRARLRERYGPPPSRKGSGLPDEVRFAKHLKDATVDPVTGCWIWPHSVNTTGYGQLGWKGSIDRAHRVSAYIFLGLEEGSPLHVLHICDVRRCVNPQHLFLGTNADNMADRNAKGHLRQGTECSGAKLTETTVAHIRILAASGATITQLANFYGVTRGCVRAAIERRTWRHVA